MEHLQRKSILEMARGAFLERADYEMSRILDNIFDINTNATKKRALNITVNFIPDSERKNIRVEVVAKSKIEPTNPIHTNLYVTADSNGEVVIAEMVPQIPGQIDMGGETQEEPTVLKLIKGA